MKAAIRSLFAASMLYACNALALMPAPGLWYNPSESGRGFAIDTQNGTMVVSTYVYDNTGHQIWFLSAGQYNESTSTFTATLDGSSGGQCLGCGYVKPTSHPNAGGQFSIVFDSLETGTAYFPGGSTRLQHFIYGYGSRTDYFAGEWAFSFNVSGTVSSQWVVFPGTHYTGSDGTVYASGYEDGVSGTVALGTYDAVHGIYIVAVQDNVGYSFFYQFLGDPQRMLGYGWIEPNGVTPTGNGSAAVGNRLIPQSELGGNLSVVDAGRYEALATKIRNNPRLTQQIPRIN